MFNYYSVFHNDNERPFGCITTILLQNKENVQVCAVWHRITFSINVIYKAKRNIYNKIKMITLITSIIMCSK